jgi:hypothetical protein
MRLVTSCEPVSLKHAKAIVMHHGEVFAIAYGNKPLTLYVCLQSITFNLFYSYAQRKAKECGAQSGFNVALERYFVPFADNPSAASVSGYTFRFTPSIRKHATYDVLCVYKNQKFVENIYK